MHIDKRLNPYYTGIHLHNFEFGSDAIKFLS